MLSLRCQPGFQPICSWPTIVQYAFSAGTLSVSLVIYCTHGIDQRALSYSDTSVAIRLSSISLFTTQRGGVIISLGHGIIGNKARLHTVGSAEAQRHRKMVRLQTPRYHTAPWPVRQHKEPDTAGPCRITHHGRDIHHTEPWHHKAVCGSSTPLNTAAKMGSVSEGEQVLYTGMGNRKRDFWKM